MVVGVDRGCQRLHGAKAEIDDDASRSFATPTLPLPQPPTSNSTSPCLQLGAFRASSSSLVCVSTEFTCRCRHDAASGTFLTRRLKIRQPAHARNEIAARRSSSNAWTGYACASTENYAAPSVVRPLSRLSHFVACLPGRRGSARL